MCMGIGFHGTVKGFHKGSRDFAVIDHCTGVEANKWGDATDMWLYEHGGGYTDGYETIELSQDAMDEGRCTLLGDMDTLTTDEDSQYFEGGNFYTAYRGLDTLDPTTYRLPAADDESDDDRYENGEEVADVVLTDRETDGTLAAVSVSGRWEMKVKGRCCGW